VAIHATPANATIRVDGRSVGHESSTQTLPPGTHEIEVSADGYQNFHRSVLLHAGDTVDVQASLDRRSSVLTSPWLWGGIGVVVVGAVAVGVGVAVSQPSYVLGTTGTILRP
jgi:hypothetical protein